MKSSESDVVSVLPRITEATVYTGWTSGNEAMATVCVKAIGIHHTELPQRIALAVNCHDDLLEACKVVQPHLAEYVQWHHKFDGGCSVEMENALDVINEAITKATTQKEGAK